MPFDFSSPTSLVNKRRILIRNHAYGPAHDSGASLVGGKSQDGRRRHRFIAGTKRAGIDLGVLIIAGFVLRPFRSFS
jgi:hypothetical protein